MNAVVIHLQIPDSSAVTKCSCPAALAHIKQMFPVQRLPHKLRPSILVIWFTADGKLSSIIKLYFITTSPTSETIQNGLTITKG